MLGVTPAVLHAWVRHFHENVPRLGLLYRVARSHKLAGQSIWKYPLPTLFLQNLPDLSAFSFLRPQCTRDIVELCLLTSDPFPGRCMNLPLCKVQLRRDSPQGRGRGLWLPYIHCMHSKGWHAKGHSVEMKTDSLTVGDAAPARRIKRLCCSSKGFRADAAISWTRRGGTLMLGVGGRLFAVVLCPASNKRSGVFFGIFRKGRRRSFQNFLVCRACCLLSDESMQRHGAFPNH